MCVWYQSRQWRSVPGATNLFRPMAAAFGIWHEPERGSHRGVHELWRQGTRLLLINVAHPASYQHLQPMGARLFLPAEFASAKGAAGSGSDLSNMERAQASATAATERGISCNAVCKAVVRVRPASDAGMLVLTRGRLPAQDKRCDHMLLPLLSSCELLQSLFACEGGCEASEGPDQPAYVTAADAPTKGKCLYPYKPALSTCDGHHPSTQRLCPCV